MLKQLRPNDRVLFFGDSITEQHLWTQYNENLLLWQEPTLVIRNRGWAANRAVDGVARFARDVAPFAPSWLFIAFGMNDGGYQPPDPHLSHQYRDSLTRLVDLARGIGAEPILCSPSCADESRDPVLQGYNETLAQLTATCHEVAAAAGCRFVDLFHPLLAASPGLIPDGIHPGPEGHLILARAVATQLGLAAQAGLGEGGMLEPTLGWRMPAPVVAGTPKEANIGSEVLTSSGANDRTRRYSVYIDGSLSGNFAGAELVKGVTLTGGGLQARSRALMDLSKAIWQMDRAAWRSHGPLGPAPSRSTAAEQASLAAVARLEEIRRELLSQPVMVEVHQEEPITLGPWSISGPYPVESPAELLTHRFAPEPGNQLDHEEGPVSTQGPGLLPWQEVEPVSPTGYVDLLPYYGPITQAVAYARTTFYAPTDGELLLSLGSDDGYRLYLNEGLVADLPLFRGSAPGQELHRLPVKAGPNQLLLRIHQGIGGWDFYATAHLRSR